VRATHGELRDDEIVHMPAPRTITPAPRWCAGKSGHDLDLNGLDTETITLGGQVLYRTGARMIWWVAPDFRHERTAYGCVDRATLDRRRRMTIATMNASATTPGPQ
jgi:hypothetical protein